MKRIEGWSYAEIAESGGGIHVTVEAVRKALENGELQWRDLVDFYARHPCKIYEFPGGYKAWTESHRQPLPVVE